MQKVWVLYCLQRTKRVAFSVIVFMLYKLIRWSVHNYYIFIMHSYLDKKVLPTTGASPRPTL